MLISWSAFKIKFVNTKIHSPNIIHTVLKNISKLNLCAKSLPNKTVVSFIVTVPNLTFQREF